MAAAKKQKINPNSKHKILVVEDDKANVLVATLYLEELGYQYDVAKNSKEALNKFKDDEYSLILMDIRMAGRDGIETTKIIRSMELGTDKHVPIVALTAEGDKERCLEAGMDDYLTKPIILDVLKDKLENNIL